jgi:hypothetical protein
MNNQNREFYRIRVTKHLDDKCALPEAAAVADLVEKAIKEKSYIVFREGEKVQEWDVIVTFSFGGDPRFGVYHKSDDETVLVSTPTGLVSYYL